jgi:Pretoxin HINT domain
VIPLFGDFAAGFASGFSGGMINEVYENYSGKAIEPQDGILHNTGWIAGLSASILSGAKFATWAKTGVGAYRWAGIAGTTADVFSEVYGYARTTQNVYYAAKDGWQWEDNWNLLGYVPLAVRGASRFIAGAKAAKAPKAESADINLRNLEQTNVKAGEVPDAGNGGTSPGKTNCFVAGTEILTPEGFKNIEDIQIGDWVISDDPTTPGEIEAKQVLQTFVRQTETLIDLYVDGEVISTTREHPFWTPDKGWLAAEDLKVGSLLQMEDGRIVDIDQIEERKGLFSVYNFHVEDFHTYYVSELGILVHNTSPRRKSNFPDDQDLDPGDYDQNLDELQAPSPENTGNRGRFQTGEDTERQLQEIEAAKQKLDQGKGRKGGQIIDSTDKSRQRAQNQRNKIKNLDDAYDQYDK